MDLLEQEGILCHQVNALGVMGAGLARKIRSKWPHVFTQYQQWCRAGNQLGHTLMVPAAPHVVVANICAQSRYGHGLQTDYFALNSALTELARQLTDRDKVFFPYKMGCGLAGGNWNIVLAIILKYFPGAVICRL